MSFKITSQLSEDQIATDVASYLGYITPIWSKKYRLIKVDESLTGSDKLFKKFIPIFIQYKVSQGLLPNYTILDKFKNFPLAKIIKYRNDNELSGNPILYFRLRKKAKNASDFQHNILRSMHKPPHQYALYIAPLTLDMNEYEQWMNGNWFEKLYFRPYHWRDSELHGITENIPIGTNPFLKGHISIPPHLVVNSDEHHYSYSKNGSDLAWHGGKVFPGDFRLSSTLYNLLQDTYRLKEVGYSAQQFVQRFNNYPFPGDFTFTLNDNFDSQSRQIIEFSQFLKNYANIDLLILSSFDS